MSKKSLNHVEFSNATNYQGMLCSETLQRNMCITNESSHRVLLNEEYKYKGPQLLETLCTLGTNQCEVVNPILDIKVNSDPGWFKNR
jgi:hypothetical protein